MEAGINPFQMSGAERTRVDEQVNMFNKVLNQGKVESRDLDKDDFLKILITQLSHQDPTKPMEDKEFIAQMAQFSSLEQMTNMSQSFQELSGRMNQTQAFSLLNQNVEYLDGEVTVNGQVEAVTGGDYPQLLVNGRYVDLDEIIQIR